MTTQEPLNPIVGSQLSSVEFVQDYVQLRFDGPCLAAFTPPSVRVGKAWFKWGSPGYRDLLCDRIGATVCTASVAEEKEIRIEFDDGALISISLRPEDYCGAEAALFDNGSEETWVW
jgi:hypothetical protein